MIRTTVEFDGSISGFVEVKVSRSTASSLAASFLGQSLGSVDSMVEATVSEVADVICGRFLSVLDPSATLSFDPPARETKAVKPPSVHRQTFQLDCGLLDITYQLKSA
jgi:CheY-specific phosphatase CheX